MDSVNLLVEKDSPQRHEGHKGYHKVTQRDFGGSSPSRLES